MRLQLTSRLAIVKEDNKDDKDNYLATARDTDNALYSIYELQKVEQ